MLSKRILAMQDLSCVGQCSLTVVLPILSAHGVETCVLPTAVLSNHTAFPRWSCLDMTPETEHIMTAWRENRFTFDAFLLGYLGSVEIMAAAKTCFRDFSAPGSKIIIDPAFGDNGKLYPAFDGQYVTAMTDLISSADVILPNLTEACFLTGTDYDGESTVDFSKKIIKQLSGLTPAAIVLTGVEQNGEIGELIYSHGHFSEVWAPKLPRRFHGTGDIFAAAFTGIYLQTNDMEMACRYAGGLVAKSILATDEAHTYGVNFEYALDHRTE